MRNFILPAVAGLALIGFLAGSALAQPAGGNWTCTSWRPAKSAVGGRECAQWSTRALPAAPTVPPPPFLPPGAPHAKAGPTAAAPKAAEDHSRRNRRKRHRR